MVKKNRSKTKKLIIGLIAFLGVSAAIAIVLKHLKQSNAKEQEYEIVMESLDEIAEDSPEKTQISKDIALRIIKLQLEKAKLAGRETLSEDNVCELNKNLKKHIEFSCKYAQDPKSCSERVFGIDNKTLEQALKVFGC